MYPQLISNSELGYENEAREVENMKLLLGLFVIVLLIPLGIMLAGLAFRVVEKLFENNGKSTKSNKTKSKS